VKNAFGQFNDDALEAFYEAYTERIDKSKMTFDFARCQRADGSYYGTAGQCRKGSPVGPKEKAPKKARVSRSSFDEATQDRLEGYIKGHDARINKALGGTPFDDADPSSEVYQRQAPKMKPYQSMTDDEKAALGMYGENVQKYYQSLNSKLRGGTSDQPSELMDYMDSNLRSGLNKITPTEPQGSTRFTNDVETKVPGQFKRAISGGAAERMTGLKPGDIIQDDGFGSFTDRGGPTLDMFLSKDKNIANAVIRLAEGSKLRNISPVTQFNEGEHIAMPGTRYRVKRVDPTGYYGRGVGDVPLYTLEVIE